MKRRNRIISAMISICMLIGMLPAQFALATEDDISDYIHGYATTMDALPTDYSGHVVRLEPSEEDSYDYSMTVSAYNMTATTFLTALKFDGNVVELVDNYGYVYDDTVSTFADCVTHGKIISEMTSKEALVGRDLVGTLFSSVDEYSQVLTKEDNSSYYRIYKYYMVSPSVTTANFTNETTGALAAQNGYSMAYTTPTNVVCDLYTLKFKVKDGQSIAADTFGIYYESIDDYHGGCAGLVASDLSAIRNSEGVYFVGFEKPAVADQNVSFTKVQNSSSQALSGATIKFYTDSARQADTGVTGTTDANGACTVSLPANTKYYYTISLNGYQSYNGEVEVKESAVTVNSLTLTKNSEVTYDTVITVTNKDTGSVIEGASVTVDGVSVEGTTDASGKITAKCVAGTHILSASKTGYQTPVAVGFTVNASGANTVSISLAPERANVTMPTASDEDRNSIDDAKIVVSKTSTNTTTDWGQLNTYDAGATATMPKATEYSVTVSATGYLSETIYLVVDEDGTATYYNDEQHTVVLNDINIILKKLSEAYYDVKVTKGDDGKTFTAHITLNNIKATKGTFGLKYNKDLFDFDADKGFVLGSADEIQLLELDVSATGKQNLDPVTTDASNDTTGYHVFTWTTIDHETSFDALAGKDIATYTFTLKDGKTEADITTDAFTVMPYDKTANGVTYIEYYDNNYADAYDFFLKDLWRYTDEENVAGSLGEGRIEESSSSMNGFYQVFVNSEVGVENADCMFDVMTNISYTNFTAQQAALEFVVTDETNIPLDDSQIKLYTADGTYITTLTADGTGIVSYPVDDSNGDVTYTYTVTHKGYWDEPETGIGTVTVPAGETKIEYIKLEKKIYHNTVLVDSEDNEIPETTATLRGDLYAYNNRDYHFNIKPAPGKKLADTSELKLEAVVNGTVYPVTYNEADNVYILAKENVTGEALTQTPDENGFVSDNIVIRIVEGEFEDSDETFTVTALAGTNGSVSYDKGTGLEATTATSKEIVISNISPVSDTTGTFTFTADKGYMVDKVFINGVEVNTYANEETFTYSFGAVTEDCNISVTFWDGKEHSTDAVVTLVVGNGGKADVTAPEAETVREARRTYMYTASGSLEFSAIPDAGYELNAVEKEVNGGAKETVSEPFNVSVAEGDSIVVYVTFKTEDAEDTFNVFVKAYIKEGKGTIDPIGILILNKYDSPKFDMTAMNTDWIATGVDINGNVVKNSSGGQTFAYIVQSVIADTSVGAIFEETAYRVIGKVDLAQGKMLTTLDAKTPATVKFVRETDKKEIKVATDTLRTEAAFEAQLPQGVWTVTVSKRGYLDYTITGYEVKADGSSEVFGEKSDGTIKKITPFIGNTSGNGKTVSLTDAGVVGSGLRQGVNEKTKLKADVDDDGSVTVTTDMAYILFNYGQRSITQTYTEFMAN